MGLLWKPHNFVIWKLVPQIVDGVLVRSDWAAGSAVDGLLVEKAPREVRELIGRESKNPAIVLMDLASAVGLQLGDRLELDGAMYQVAADPQTFYMGLATDHARLIVERLD